MNGYAIGGFFLVLVLACWAFVIPHQLGFLDSFNPPRYSALEAVIPIAYCGAGLSLCFLAAIVAMLVKK